MAEKGKAKKGLDLEQGDGPQPGETFRASSDKREPNLPSSCAHEAARLPEGKAAQAAPTDVVHIEAPPPVDIPHRSRTLGTAFSILGAFAGVSLSQQRSFCARADKVDVQEYRYGIQPVSHLPRPLPMVLPEAVDVEPGQQAEPGQQEKPDNPPRVASDQETTSKIRLSPARFRAANVLLAPGFLDARTYQWTRHSVTPANKGFANCKYVVVGLMGRDESVPHEVLLPIRPSTNINDDLFHQLHRAIRQLRPLYRRVLSLKHVAGFSVCRCMPRQGCHSDLEVDHETQGALVELYRDFRTLRANHGDRWLDWIHVHFNDTTVAVEGTLALQLVLRWSPVRLVFWGLLPIVLSLVLGLWVMLRPWPGKDYLAVVQTAWGIASYIVTAAALALAILASITQIGGQ